ncbi:monoamine oxidase [Algoriphagus ratkowskyi]|uniref:FAD-dependent oxidoreductase n=1 Tax=Algoriphagus ratkowskyi TaxID=57028 RepID=A0A2W7QX43_9BACT|nr:NAD(P)/FAD-dependent oxidoreductase [Algoriphagus ratkowskyi]PZX53088.1 monoamine oxidase [Algoriphagus ratkowskyi]TXD76368.1 FAD-dependent oxidoreductase [Algoriphagus ratkowskyi]
MIILIGAGLSGLLTAYRLKKEGIAFKILEARTRIGGRINTVVGSDNTPVEMGATWFSDQHQHLRALLDELGIKYFEQYMEGNALYQASSAAPAEAIQIPRQAPSYRISGGTSHLIETLFKALGQKNVLLDQTVTEIRFRKDAVEVIAKETFIADKVVLALPPKLWAKKIKFDSALPSNLMAVASHTHTWMEDSIKVALSFSTPFWQEHKLSGLLFSNPGPVVEFYDHSNNERSKFALCGFVNSSYKILSFEERKARIITQLKRAFGTQIENFIDYTECVWSDEINTFEPSDIEHFPHQNNGNPIFKNTFYDDRMIISSAESAAQSPGYMDGAVYAGNLTANKLIAAN